MENKTDIYSLIKIPSLCPLKVTIADNKYNKLTLNYTMEEVYVSRSCGFKTIFKNVTVASDNGWFQSFTPNSITSIDNENNAHIKIFH